MRNIIFLIVCAVCVNSTASNLPNREERGYFSRLKDKITQTVKADLGFTDELFTGHETHSEQLSKEIGCAVRMCMYQLILNGGIIALSSFVPGKIHSRYNDVLNRPGFFKTVILAPLWEEFAFTANGLDSPHRPGEFHMPGGKYRRRFIPILFGLGHYHKDPKTYFINASSAALMSFMHINHVNAYWGRKVGVSKVPWFHHMINNFVAYYAARYQNRAEEIRKKQIDFLQNHTKNNK